MAHAGMAASKRTDRNPLTAAFTMLGNEIRVDRNAEIYGEGEPAEYFYEVATGAVRTYKVLDDGRRQIGAFYLPGDIFGLEADEEHSFSAEGVSRSTLRTVKRSVVLALARRDNAVASELWRRTAGGLRSAQEHMLVLGRKNAEERVMTFLLDMARRGSAKRLIELPMSRQDIADYLGLTIETVSRTLTLLENKAAIALPSSRRIVLRPGIGSQSLHA